ncbi:hypothetical protein FACS1894172_10030 [Spirochaetia bacterium]|nr:hypothetical protein FACS1894172_10030 [Spirochaetia bacterium]
MTDIEGSDRSVEKNERLLASFIRLSEENQAYILGQAEGIKVAQDMLKVPLYTGICVSRYVQTKV